ncbi:MAG: trigger factor [Oscillospiraceae bacterium]|nr:trigger factor [Oscillospiraceae bacterium]
MQFTYKGLKAKLEKHTVTGEEVDRNLQRLLQQNPRIVEVNDRPTQLGDEVVLNYAGFCDGVQFPGGTAENQTLVLGSGMFIPGFEEQLVDKVPGEEVTVKVTFPEQYHSEDLAGKEAEFKCKILKIRLKTPYELDDTFAKEVGQCDTLEEMRARLQESLQSYADQRGEMELQDQLLNEAAKTLELTVTDEMLADAVEDQLNNLRAQLAQQGLSLEMYCQFMNTTEDALREDAKPAAEAALRCRAAIDEIVMIEGLEPDQEEITKTLVAICRQNNITMEQLKEQYDAALEQAVINSVLTGKVMRLIRDAAIVEE